MPLLGFGGQGRFSPGNLLNAFSLGGVPQTEDGKKNLVDRMRLSSSLLKGAGSIPKPKFIDIGGGYMMRQDPSWGEQISALLSPMAESNLAEEQRQLERVEKNEDLDKAVGRAIWQAVKTAEGTAPVEVWKAGMIARDADEIAKRAEQRKKQIDIDLKEVDARIARAKAEGDLDRMKELEREKDRLARGKAELEAQLAEDKSQADALRASQAEDEAQGNRIELEDERSKNQLALEGMEGENRLAVAQIRSNAAAQKAAASAANKLAAASMKLSDAGKLKVQLRGNLAEKEITRELARKKGFFEGLLSEEDVSSVTSTWFDALTAFREENGEPVFAFEPSNIPWDDLDAIRSRLEEFKRGNQPPAVRPPPTSADAGGKYDAESGKKLVPLPNY